MRIKRIFMPFIVVVLLVFYIGNIFGDSQDAAGHSDYLRFEPGVDLSDPPPPESIPPYDFASPALDSTDDTDAVEPDTTIPEFLLLPEKPINAADAPFPRTSNPRRTLESVDIDAFLRRLEADRKLLIEIRKGAPETRQEAGDYLARLKFLSGISDPVRLVPLVNRVLDQAPIYFDWLDKEFEDDNDTAVDYVRY